ncbi:unnamed protein product [Gongylonema pulchrum]|uniref:SCP domain-containing protein n=1 Tax=Gongylonema pulchrum TaxID=637853 RepID=A0A183E184_9BILA|nr:unnamed protein product [Gongylonema pulchrum]
MFGKSKGRQRLPHNSGFRKPRPPKKAKKRGAVRGDFSLPSDTNTETSKIHVLYETAITVWDNRIRDKSDKKLAQEKRQRRFKVCPRSGRVRSSARQWYLAEIAENKENEASEKCEIGDRDEVLNAKPSVRDITLEYFVVNRCAKVTTKKRKQETLRKHAVKFEYSLKKTLEGLSSKAACHKLPSPANLCPSTMFANVKCFKRGLGNQPSLYDYDYWKEKGYGMPGCHCGLFNRDTAFSSDLSCGL